MKAKSDCARAKAHLGSIGGDVSGELQFCGSAVCLAAGKCKCCESGSREGARDCQMRTRRTRHPGPPRGAIPPCHWRQKRVRNGSSRTIYAAAKSSCDTIVAPSPNCYLSPDCGASGVLIPVRDPERKPLVEVGSTNREHAKGSRDTSGR